MKEIIATALAIATVGGTAMADITVNVNPSIQDKEFEIEYGYVADMVKPRMERPEALHATGKVENGKFTLKTLPDGAAQYVIPAGERSYIMLYTEPGQDLTVNINSTTARLYSDRIKTHGGYLAPRHGVDQNRA